MASLLGGVLQPVLEAVKKDDTLMLGLRGTYVSIYYRGGELLKIQPATEGGFRGFFGKLNRKANFGRARRERFSRKWRRSLLAMHAPAWQPRLPRFSSPVPRRASCRSAIRASIDFATGN